MSYIGVARHIVVPYHAFRQSSNFRSRRAMSAIDAAAARQAARSVPGLPCDAEGPVFREPWEAQAFAIVVTLHERGLFGWDEWAAMLGEEIKAAQRAGDPDTGETYYRHWLAALERMVAHKGLADR